MEDIFSKSEDIVLQLEDIFVQEDDLNFSRYCCYFYEYVTGTPSGLVPSRGVLIINNITAIIEVKCPAHK